MNLSIIIPALEEEKKLPLLLGSIKKQRYAGKYEIIVADAGSKDKTIEIAIKYGCRIVRGGLPAKGRNEGAKKARGGLLLFLDADTELPESFLGKTIAEFEKRNLDIAGFFLQPTGKSKLLDFLYEAFYNKPVLLLERILPHAVGAILVKKTLYQKIDKGFDESIKLAEDHFFAREAAKKGKFGIIRSSKIYYSQRRFQRKGWIRTYLKYLLAELHLVFIGPIRSDIFKYKF